ncbi:fungal-specific transcription factor domain-containing protein [Colletotrichum acutatum]|uniref:Fungal-specific transcription factor domain-containing protein n=1 Tax=Glomerella acutata TaxID=27357 RepID=A0AAD8UE19_GLOAC|nr:fungal-specific transcription factor domain-containing protein [Colletotrichum acutatum]KAK1718728.1 fungal-specific transcription factor domain-containing protein [Colletotrichum acutatum]
MSPASRATRDSERRKLRRTTNACISCRQSKIKCSGEQPCANCQRRLMKCEYSEGTNITVNTESSGRQRLGSEQQSTPRSKRSRGEAFGSDDEDYNSQSVECRSSQLHDSSECVYTSPFTLPSTTIKNTHKNKRNWIWLAPSSTWSFTARLTLMMAERLQVETPFSAPSFLNDEIYPLRWKASTVNGQPDISGLPSIDHAIYLFNTVKFHLGQNYQLIDEANFVKNLEEFYYGLASKKAAESPLWFVQFLLVLSFGQAFLSRSKDSKEPPGAKFFVRAMALLPEPNALWKDSLLAIEVLALAGLYLYSIYQRESAQLYIAQAIRIAQLEGLHTQLPEDALGTQAVARCRNLWWTLYIMDRHFSCSVGVPMNTQDADITTMLDPPSICSQRDATLGLQVKLSRLLSSIITTIYRSEKTPLGDFLTSTKSILHTLAGHAQEIERITRFKFQNSVDAMPKGTRSITLLYHQCVIMATRPLFLSALKQELESFGWGGRDPKTFSPPLKTLVETGIKSAVKTLQILSGDDSLLEVFLPFELEYAYGAAIHLTMANALFPAVIGVDGAARMEQTHAILDDMFSKGNLVAEVRKAELVHLESLFRKFTRRVRDQDFGDSILSTARTLNGILSGSIEAIIDPSTSQTFVNESDLVSTTTLSESQPLASVISDTPDNTEFLETIGISSDDFLSIVELMGSEDDLPFSMLDLGQFWK